MNHPEPQSVCRPPTPGIAWIAAIVIGLIGCVAWWVPSYPPDPWATIIAWLVWIGVAVLSAAVVYMLGARGRTVVLASALAAATTFLAWPVIFDALVVIGEIIELMFGFLSSRVTCEPGASRSA
jgi:hypothetical protein